MPPGSQFRVASKEERAISVPPETGTNGSARRRLSLLPAGVGILVLLVAAAVWFSHSLAPTTGQMAKVGQPAPPFTLHSLNGEAVRLEDFAGQPVLINFWATWCPECRDETPLLQEAYETYKDQGFVVLAVDVQESPEMVKPFLEQYGLAFPIILDHSGVVSSAYRVLGLPTSVFVDRNGNVVDIHQGALTPESLQGYLNKILTP